MAGQRLSAFLLDMLIMFGSMIALTLVLVIGAGSIGDEAGAEMAAVLWLLGFFFIRNGYFILLELSPRAATFGKRLIGLRVVARNGGQLTADAVIARNLMRELELFLPLSFLAMEAAESGVESAAWILGLIWAGIFFCFPFFNKDRLRVGDVLAGTWVIHAPQRSLSVDLLAGQAEAPPGFTEEQLSAYGILELQTLEQVLRTANPQAIATVATTIRGKISAPDEGDDAEFLQAYYSALRIRLERGLLLGQRRSDKHSS
ncbi:MAG TPA: RDD family protein [Allosphingosinicella sp.]|nr:RDD family protein [Allosphingosinicella sp.]